MKLEIELERLPRLFYAPIVSIEESLEESGVPQREASRALDWIERAILKALSRSEEEADESSEDSDSEDEGEDGDEEAVD